MLRGLIVWLIIMGFETIHGLLRGLYLVPRVGEAAAGRIGWPIGLVIVLATATAFARWIAIRDIATLLGIGAVWAILTLGFEFAIGLLRGMSPAAIMTEIDPLSGGLTIYSLGVMLAAPWIAARLRHMV
ncbi:MAG: hypothetical protein KDK89_08725 [Alphaproteobacteria bacterium]|nr:hypothetical protein [Alphaproteobacteria bacterium]